MQTRPTYLRRAGPRYPRKAGARPIGARFALRREGRCAHSRPRAGLVHRPGPAVRACGAEPITTPQIAAWPPKAATRGVSADPLSQGNDDPLWPANVGHTPDLPVLTDAADQAVAIRGQPVDRRLKVVDFE